MTLSFFITVIPDHDKPQPPGCLLDVVTRRHEQLVVELGLEETAARRLLDVCYARSDAWEKENGGTIYVR
ncbi:hypothetical protein [Escherichia coli]|uniref:hypothetical protein n=1 Tax=Escherichia coli TaxID=562 RepID=UPI001F16567B|nr:hypothetical protein [Escherichia coli]